jgi:hypothetical protein
VCGYEHWVSRKDGGAELGAGNAGMDARRGVSVARGECGDGELWLGIGAGYVGMVVGCRTRTETRRYVRMCGNWHWVAGNCGDGVLWVERAGTGARRVGIGAGCRPRTETRSCVLDV